MDLVRQVAQQERLPQEMQHGTEELMQLGSTGKLVTASLVSEAKAAEASASKDCGANWFSWSREQGLVR